MMSVSLSNNGKTLKLRHYDINRAHFQGTAQRLIYISLPTQDRQKYGEGKVGRLVKSMYGTQDASHIWQLDYVNLICGELGGFRRGKHSAALFHNPNQDARVAVHGDDFVCLSDDDGLKHIDSLLKSKYTAKDMGTLGFEDSDVISLLLLNHAFRVGVDQTGQYLDIEPDLRHAPLIISESGCNSDTKAVSTPRGKLQDELVPDERRSPILNRDDAIRYGSACMRLSFLAQERLDLAETAKHLTQRMSESRDIRLCPMETCSAISGVKAQSGAAVFSAAARGGQVGLSLISMYQDLGIPMKIEIQSDSSTANSLTDPLGAGQRTKHFDTRYFWRQERVQDRDLSIEKVPTAKNCADVGMKPVSASEIQQPCKLAGLVFY